MVVRIHHPRQNGVLVQLVRMPPCHGGGHGFESRTHRKQNEVNCYGFMLSCKSHIVLTNLSSVSICSGEALVGFQRGDVGKNVRHILKGAGSTPARYAKTHTAIHKKIKL